MTLDEIKIIFNNIHDTYPDGLDAFMILSVYENEYKTSEFYQKTNISIYDAYTKYYQTTLHFQDLIQTIQNVLNNLDYTDLEKTLDVKGMFDQIPEDYRDIFKSALQSVKDNVKAE